MTANQADRAINRLHGKYREAVDFRDYSPADREAFHRAVQALTDHYDELALENDRYEACVD